MSGLAYFFKPKINPTESTSSATTAEKRSGRRSKSSKSAEIVEKPPTPVEAVEASPEVKPMAEEQVENPPSATPKIKLKFNLRSQSVQDTSDDRFLSTVNNEQLSHLSDNDEDEDDESSDMDTRLKIDDQDVDLDEHEFPLPMENEPMPLPIVSPTKKKGSSSRKKVISHLIGTSTNTLALDEPSPIKVAPNESQFSEVKQTKSGRTIKYTPYFKELVQGATISPPPSPSHTTSPSKRPSNHSKKKQSSIKADLDAIKNGSLPTSSPTKGKKLAAGSPKTKKQTSPPVKRLAQGKKSTLKTTIIAKSKRASNPPVVDEEVESDDENDNSQIRSDDEEFHQEGDTSEEEDEDDGLDDDNDHSFAAASDEEEWTGGGIKFDPDRSLGLTSTLGSISSEMLDGYSLWAMKYRARHRTMALDDKRLYRTWKKMSAHDRQRWCLKAEKENFHYPITAELLKATTTSETSTAGKPAKTTKRKKGGDDQPPILLQKTLNQYSKQQPSLSSIRPPTAFVKQPVTPTAIAPPKNYDVVDIAAGIYLLGESLTKMGEKVRQLGHLNPRGTSAATSIDNLSAILFDGTLCACSLMACLGNEITTSNPSSTRSDPLTNKLMENVGIILPGLN